MNSEGDHKVTFEEVIMNSMIYRWGPRLRIWAHRFWSLVKRGYWALQRGLRIGWQGRLVSFRKEADKIMEAEQRSWYRPSFASWASPEDKAREKKLRELEKTLRAPNGEMTIGRLAAKMIEREREGE